MSATSEFFDALEKRLRAMWDTGVPKEEVGAAAREATREWMRGPHLPLRVLEFRDYAEHHSSPAFRAYYRQAMAADALGAERGRGAGGYGGGAHKLRKRVKES